MKKILLLLSLISYKTYSADQELKRLGEIELDSHPRHALLRQRLYQQEKSNISLRERLTATENKNRELSQQNLVLKNIVARLNERMGNIEEMNRIISEDLALHHRRLSAILQLLKMHQEFLERHDKDELETISEPELSD
ncbi:hypothetical protein A3F66_05615 [candidate division TM6 bacterium RIFCSPHIGHO2_12_FULL_32_22]|nr:MAG: hypothetical protein A3F66_05615 [candidate division TM6 bacterium RIFCSPHIGHO2_12_FULL_32_22]